MDEIANATLSGPAVAGALAAALEAPATQPAGSVSPARDPGGAVPARSGPRPGVVQLAIREKAALYAAYMPFIEGGGLFVPTTRPVNLGDELYLILSLVDDPNKLSVTGKVVWVTPASTTGRHPGLGVQFSQDEAGLQARNRIENLLGGAMKANRPTHTL